MERPTGWLPSRSLASGGVHACDMRAPPGMPCAPLCATCQHTDTPCICIPAVEHVHAGDGFFQTKVYRSPLLQQDREGALWSTATALRNVSRNTDVCQWIAVPAGAASKDISFTVKDWIGNCEYGSS